MLIDIAKKQFRIDTEPKLKWNKWNMGKFVSDKKCLWKLFKVSQILFNSVQMSIRYQVKGIKNHDFSWTFTWKHALGWYFQKFYSENAKIFLVISGIFCDNFGEFDSAKFCQIKKNVCFFCYKHSNENPTCEINRSSNISVKVYRSNSGHTFENWLSEKPAWDIQKCILEVFFKNLYTFWSASYLALEKFE